MIRVGKGKLTIFGTVSVPIRYKGKARIFSVLKGTSIPTFLCDNFEDGLIGGIHEESSFDWKFRLSTKPAENPSWNSTPLPPEDVKAIQDEADRCFADPDQQRRVLECETRMAVAPMRTALKNRLKKLRPVLKDLIGSGVNPVELEETLTSLIREVVIEAVQEC